MLERMIASAKKAKVGDPQDKSTLIGPMISKDAADKVSRWVDEAIAKGAKRHG